MKTVNKKHGALILSLLLGITANVMADEWSGLFEECERAGVEAGSLKRVMKRFREKSIAEDTAQDLLAPACDAARAGLPSDPVLAKIEEGLAKNVGVDVIEQAAQNRYRHLERARDMLQHRKQSSRRGESELLASVGLALEGGMPDAVIQDVLNQTADRRPGEVRALVEAGDTLYLNGFDPEASRDVMMDCLQRNLRRTEIIRTVRYAVQRRGAGMEPQTIRKALWGAEAAGEQQQAGAHKAYRNMQHAGPAGSIGGTGAGTAPPGPGGPGSGSGGDALAPGSAPQSPPAGAPGPSGTAPGGGGGGGTPGKGPGGK